MSTDFIIGGIYTLLIFVFGMIVGGLFFTSKENNKV